MRMANERDQAIVRSAVSDAAANLLAFVPSLGTREVLAFGEGVALPTRLKFKQLPENLIPQSQAVINAIDRSVAAATTEDFIDTIIDRWRGATMSKQNGLDGGADFESLARDEFSTLSGRPAGALDAVAQPHQLRRTPAAAPRLDPDRFRLLKQADRRRAATAFRAASRCRRQATAKLQRESVRLPLQDRSGSTARGPRGSPSPRSASA